MRVEVARLESGIKSSGDIIPKRALHLCHVGESVYKTTKEARFMRDRRLMSHFEILGKLGMKRSASALIPGSPSGARSYPEAIRRCLNLGLGRANSPAAQSRSVIPDSSTMGYGA
jgi:hypothetical protein